MKISIITINYNNNEGLRKTILSVLEQKPTLFEYIVIDGMSSDGSVETIREYDSCIDYWVSEKDTGIYNAMNKGIARATGDYCIFMNSGDVFYQSDVLESIIPYLDGTAIINGDTVYASGKYDKSPDEVTLSYLMLSTIIHQSTFIRTDLLKHNNYDEKYRLVSDWKFWLQELIINNVSYKNIHIPISIFEEGGVGTTNVEVHDREMVQVLQELFPDRLLKEYYNFLNGRTWEEKLYKEIQHSRLHKIMYVFNCAMIKLLTFFNKSSKWTGKYPLFFKQDMRNDNVLTDIYGNRNILRYITKTNETVNNNN